METPKDFLHPVRARNVSELISLVPSPAQTPAPWCFGHVPKSQGLHLPLALVSGGISEHGAGPADKSHQALAQGISEAQSCNKPGQQLLPTLFYHTCRLC